MNLLLEKFDSLAGVERDTPAIRWMERVAFFFLLLMVVSAPHSIAATQIAWLTGMSVWLLSIAIRWKSGRNTFKSNGPPALRIALLLFFAWLYNLYGPGNGTDPAGRGIGLCFTLALGGYILAGAGLMFLPVGWGVVTVIVMAALPLAIVVIGLIKWLTPRRW